jgi:Bacterial regulatory helix-turn-helix protein, lysR family
MDVLWAMKVFVRVAETGSFSRAAEILDVANRHGEHVRSKSRATPARHAD